MSILDYIFAASRVRLKARKHEVPLEELKQHCHDLPPTRGFAEVLRRTDRLAFIAEIKPKSPSAGILKANLSVEDIARDYEAVGADALSILTEPDYFGGSLDNLRKAKNVVRLPLLRKDFIFDVYQLFEGRAAGADAILLIAAMLSPEQVAELCALARELSLDVLLEFHSEEELNRLPTTEPVICGVNHRNLRTMKIDLSISEQLFPCFPNGFVKVAESGISTAEDLIRVRKSGADAVLVGTHLMKAQQPGKALRELVSASCG
ncbi:indole-3-glycerol phosphate synthase TrpC [bacterium]|nr:indole-3-glycerol phosphate synthase TrpC [bacterium]